MMSARAAANKDALGGDAHAFQHRHYAFVAAIIRGLTLYPHEKRQLATNFADAFQANPRFQRGRFMDAATKPTA